MSNTIHVAKVLDVLDNGDAVLELPPDMLKELQWEAGDKLDFLVENESVKLKNLSKDERDAKHNNN